LLPGLPPDMLFDTPNHVAAREWRAGGAFADHFCSAGCCVSSTEGDRQADLPNSIADPAPEQRRCREDETHPRRP